MSINGPTTWNDSVMPGYRVTKTPVNLTAWQMLPDRTIRNWGDMTSYTTYNKPNMTPLEGFLANNILDPNHISQWDPMLFTLGGMPTQNTTNPFLTNMGVMGAYNLGLQFRVNSQRVSMIQGMARALGSLESQLTQLIENDQLTDKQKEKLEAKLEEVKEFKQKVEEALQNEASLEDVQALAGELVELQKSISEVIKEIAKEVKESNEGNDDGSDDAGDAGKKDDETKTDNDGRPASLGEKPSKTDIEVICSGIDSAYAYWMGTDKSKLDDNLKVLDKSNIVEIISYWNKNYKNNSSGKSNFFDSMMAELNQFELDDRVPAILATLQQRAEANGIYDEISEYVSNVNKALNQHWWNNGLSGIDKDKIATNLQKIVDKIVAKEKANATDEKGKSDKAKAEEKKKADEEAKEAKATFLSDLKEYFGDNELEISDKVQYKDGKFKVHTVKGKSVDYEATSFMGLVKKLEKDDLDPKEYLAKKKSLNTKA
jgi:uncharacterized coiled-coil DUF342 family protein